MKIRVAPLHFSELVYQKTISLFVEFVIYRIVYANQFKDVGKPQLYILDTVKKICIIIIE